MSKSYKQITQDINSALAPFRKEADGTMSGFSALVKAAMAPGAKWLALGYAKLTAV